MRLLANYGTVILTLLTLLIPYPPKTIIAGPNEQARIQLSDRPALFIPNRGQWNESVLFRSEVQGVTLWFTRDGVYHQFTRSFLAAGRSAADDLEPVPETGSPLLERMIVASQFVGGDPEPVVVAEEPVAYLTNFLIGSDPANWQTDIPGYLVIEYKSLYPGIDVRYQVRNDELEYDLILAPGADPSVARFKYLNAREVAVDPAGNLVIVTDWGEIIEQAPVIYQMVNNERSSLAGSFRMVDQTEFRFELIDQPEAGYPVIIDPVVSYMSSFGGSGNDEGFGITVDDDGSAYVTGYTASSDFPVENPFQVVTGGGFYDAFVVKMTSSGSGFVYSSYLGGASDDRGHSIAVDSDGSAYVTGFTFSTDFPTTAGAYQSAHSGGVSDAFVIKLNPQGNGLVYGSYLGGSGHDVGQALVIDEWGQAHITGHTRSTNFPTVNPFQASLMGINFDAFLTKISSAGDSILYSSYLGGSVSDYGRDLTLDRFGNAYVAGYTKSIDFPTLNPFQSQNNGDYDGFVTRFSLAGEGPMFSTYLGGSAADHINAISIDSSLITYLSGYTFSSDFPTLNAFQTGHGGGQRDIFVARLNDAGRSLLSSTYLGGSDEDYSYGLVLNSQGSVGITGNSYSNDFPLANPHQATLNGLSDAILSVLSLTMDQLEYSTYLGGSLQDVGYDMAVDPVGNIFVTGVTGESFSRETAVDPDDQLASGGLFEMFVTKFVDNALCCGAYTAGFTGNTNCDSDGKRNLADITRLIDRVYLTKASLCCPANGNINGDLLEKINLADITRLIDHVYVSKSATATCI